MPTLQEFGAPMRFADELARVDRRLVDSIMLAKSRREAGTCKGLGTSERTNQPAQLEPVVLRRLRS